MKRPLEQKVAGGDRTEHAWTSYLPVWMQPELDRCPHEWKIWLAQYVTRVLGSNALRRNLIRTYVTHVYNVLLRRLECRSVDAFLALRREDLAQAVVDANAVHVHQQRLCRIAVNHFVSGVVFRDHRALVERLHLRTRDLPYVGRPIDGATRPQPYDNVDVMPCTRTRDHFTETEMQALLAVPQLNPRDRLMLCIMAETGLRRRAVSWLLVDAVYDRTRGAPLDVGAATEKGLVVRRFTLSAPTRLHLDDYIRNHHPGASTRWLFPSPHHGAQAPISAGVVSQVLARACKLAGIRGRHVHTHAIRKGVVCRLMRANNRIENVAKWLGHKTVNLTYATYWDVDGLDVANGMNIPWLEDSPTP
jgi:integrase